MAVFAPQTQRVFDNPTPLHTPNDMFDSHPGCCNPTIFRFLVWGERSTAWLLFGLLHTHPVDHKALKAPILIQDTVGWEYIDLLVCHGFIVPTAFICGAQKPYATVGSNQQQVFDGMLLLLPTKMKPLFI